MAKIHQRLYYQTDAIQKILLKNEDGDTVTGATGTYVLTTAAGSTLQSGSMSEEGSGWYFFQIPDDLSVEPGDILLSKITMVSGAYQCYGEYEIFVETDRR